MIQGIAAAPGVGVGTAYLLHERVVPLGNADVEESGSEPHPQKTSENELNRFTTGRTAAAADYRTLTDRIRSRVGEDEAEIFEGHLEILTGDDLAEAVETTILSESTSAEQAVRAFVEATAEEFEQLESEYFQQRASDIRDIGNRLVEAIYFGSISDPGQLPDNSVVVADELTPSATARLDISRVVAIVTEKGGRTSHAAILARSLSIPCVTGVTGFVTSVRPGQWLMVDGDTGTIDTDVDESTRKEIDRRRREAEAEREAQMRWSRETPTALSDGTPIHLSANVSGVMEAERAAAVGAEGSGLVRSEFIFMGFSDYPTVDQQAEEYRKICELLAPHPVVVRLLDCGADKPLPYGRHESEDNPFLGERGIRFLMARPERLRQQISAICRVAAEGLHIQLMVPMVINTDEIEQVRLLVAEETPESAEPPPVGIMVETPASVMRIEPFAAAADFVSVGTNDLIQYMLAVDRGNTRVASLYDEFNLTVLAALDRIFAACRAAGTHAAVCGDMASHGNTALVLLALGAEELSAAGPAIPGLKRLFRSITASDLEGLAGVLRSAASAEDARRAVETVMERQLERS